MPAPPLALRTQFEMMIAEANRLVRRTEKYAADIRARGHAPRACVISSLDRQQMIRAYLQRDYEALITGSPLQAALTPPPATEHHGPDEISISIQQRT